MKTTLLFLSVFLSLSLFGQSFFYSGFEHDKKGEYKEAVDDYTIAIKINPDYADAYLNRGVAKEQLGIDDCNDYNKACQLGSIKGCEYFKMDGCN